MPENFATPFIWPVEQVQLALDLGLPWKALLASGDASSIADTRHIQETFQFAKEKKLMVAHGAPCKGKSPGALPGDPFLDVAIIRMNHNATRIDPPSTQDIEEKGDVPYVVNHILPCRQR